MRQAVAYLRRWSNVSGNGELIKANRAPVVVVGDMLAPRKTGDTQPHTIKLRKVGPRSKRWDAMTENERARDTCRRHVPAAELEGILEMAGLA